MTIESSLAIANFIDSNLKIAKELVYDKCGFDLTNLEQNLESKEYAACCFELDEKKIHYRVSKITPTKTGQFVTIWKRNKIGKTVPFDISDHFDFVIITSVSGDNFGQFVFPKSFLAKKGVISTMGIGGKRGIRVYPPWDIVSNKQAESAQNWQTKYFLTIKNNGTTEMDVIQRLLAIENEID